MNLWFFIIIHFVFINFVFSQRNYYGVEGLGKLSFLGSNKFIFHINECAVDTGEYRIVYDKFLKENYYILNSQIPSFSIELSEDKIFPIDSLTDICFRLKIYDTILCYEGFKTIECVYLKHHNDSVFIICEDLKKLKKDQIIILENQYCERIPLIWKGKNFENTGNSSTLIKYSIKNKNYIYFHNFILKEKKNYLFPTYNSQKIYFNLNNDFFPLVRKRFLQKKYQLKKCNIY